MTEENVPEGLSPKEWELIRTYRELTGRSHIPDALVDEMIELAGLADFTEVSREEASPDEEIGNLTPEERIMRTLGKMREDFQSSPGFVDRVMMEAEKRGLLDNDDKEREQGDSGRTL